MLTLPPSTRVYLARGATDMRKSIDGLAAATKHVLKKNPFSSHLFGFCNRRQDRIKILYWEESGFWLLYKRLEKGTFAWPVPEHDRRIHVELKFAEFAALLGGLDIRGARRRQWFSRTG